MSAGDLAGPAEADFDFAVGGFGAIADNEVVAESIPAAFAMGFIERAAEPTSQAAVMDDDDASGQAIGRKPLGVMIDGEVPGRRTSAPPGPVRRSDEGAQRGKPREKVASAFAMGLAHP